MSDRSDPVFDGLLNLIALGSDAPSTAVVRERVRAAIDAEIARGARPIQPRTGPAPTHAAPGPRRLRTIFGTVLSCALTAAVVATVLVAIPHRRPAAAAHPATPTSADRALLSRLAVLGRPGTPSDRLPAGTDLPTSQGYVLPASSRLVSRRFGARIYMVLVRPATGPGQLWPGTLGDQVALIGVRDGDAFETAPSPAVNLTNPAPQLIQLPRRPGTAEPTSFYVQPIPDGVERVSWITGVETARARSGNEVFDRVTVAVRNNTAIVAIPAHTGSIRQAVWVSTDGRRVPTSARANHRAEQARAHRESSSGLRAALRSHIRAAPQLLRAFSVFDFTGPGTVSVSPGVSISHPPLTSIPADVLSTAVDSEGGGGWALDLRQVRKVTTRAGVILWVMPGPKALCVAGSDLPRAATGGVKVTLGCDPVNEAVRHGAEQTLNGRYAFGIFPRSDTTPTVRLAGTIRTVHPIDGVYVKQLN